ncbi:MAG: thiol-disulfide oxidoreductase DCC family protein [Candidatus Poseidoniales archaeon]
MLGDDSLPIVLFDGFCSTCNRWAQWISKHDSKNAFELIPQESPEGETVMGSCPESLVNVDSVYVVNDNQWHARSSAVCRMLWKLRLHWKITGALLWLIPRPLRDYGYDMFAKRRHRLLTADS